MEENHVTQGYQMHKHMKGEHKRGSPEQQRDTWELKPYLLVIWLGSWRSGSKSKTSLSSSLRSVTSASCSIILNTSSRFRNVEKSRSLFCVVIRMVSVRKTLDVRSNFRMSTHGITSLTGWEKDKSELQQQMMSKISLNKNTNVFWARTWRPI